MGVLSNLEPAEVFRYFEEICGIPHPSYKEKKLSAYCVEFAKERGLEVNSDELGNVVIIKEATPGYEKAEPLILQGHLDMVCEKEPDCEIDFENEGLRLVAEGDTISAAGTTLGGDDGIAIAYALAVLASDTLEHPRIEAVFTVSEEVGMEGAAAVDLSMLKGHKLLNIDSEVEGHLLTSCAGGCRANVMLPAARQPWEGGVYELTIGGLKGGHSGIEIDKGRANSNMLMGRLLLALKDETSYSVVSMQGGLKDNAIPRETKALIVVEKGDEERFQTLIAETGGIIRREYETADPDISIHAEKKGEETVTALTKECRDRALSLMNLLPNGVQAMSAEIAGLVETSLNLGVLTLDEGGLTLRYALRSSVQTARDFLAARMRLLTEQLGGSMTIEGCYPAWEYRKDSPLREDMVRIYRELFGKEPVIEAIHAGVECGLLADKIPDLDAVSFGPDMTGIHTTQEKLSISSVKRMWDYLVEILRQK